MIKALLLFSSLLLCGNANADVITLTNPTGTSGSSINDIRGSTLTITGQSNLSVPVVITDTAGRLPTAPVVQVSSSNGTNMLALSAAGNFTLGPLPSTFLPVRFAANVGTDLNFKLFQDAASIGALALINDGNSGYATMRLYGGPVELWAAGVQKFTVGTNSAFVSGNVGIGTTSPTYTLHVASNVLVASGSDDTRAAGITLSGTYAGFNLEPGGAGNNRNWSIRNGYGSAGMLELWNSAAAAGTPLGTRRVVIDKDGNFGIGTVSPGVMLELGAGANFRVPSGAAVQWSNANTKIVATSGAGARMDFWLNSTSGALNIYEGGIVAMGPGAIKSTFTATGDLFTATGSSITIGTSVSVATATLLVNGGGVFNGNLVQKTLKSCATGTQTDADGLFSACVASDASLKKNIAPLPYNPTLIDSLRPVTFEWKDKSRGVGKKSGFIAQEVQAVSPTSVVPAGTGLKGIDANSLTAALVSELKALRKRVAELEKKP